MCAYFVFFVPPFLQVFYIKIHFYLSMTIGGNTNADKTFLAKSTVPKRLD